MRRVRCNVERYKENFTNEKIRMKSDELVVRLQTGF